MPAGDYWDDDELQDRIYYAREDEKRAQHLRKPSGGFRWPLRRSKAWPILVLLVFLWWFMSSGEKPQKVDWTRFAYSQYATDTQSLCNALMIFESLHQLGSKADRILLYPQEWRSRLSDRNDRNTQLIQIAQKSYKVKLEPVQLLGSNGFAGPGTLDSPSNWDLSVTKLRTFDLVQYDRVLHIDSDATLLQHLDELFLLPRTPIAMPRAYWSDGPPESWQLTSLLMLLEPNPREVSAMMNLLGHWRTDPHYSEHKRYDMDLLNHRFGASAMVLPHRPYAMLTAEFRRKDHDTYLGTRGAHRLDPRKKWDPDKAIKEAKLVHFSDWPLPKPWIMWPIEGLSEIQPDCGGAKVGTCREREIWKKLYDDFRRKRRDTCKILSVPAPDNWWLWKNTTGFVDAVSGPQYV